MIKYIKDYPRPQFVRDDWLSLNGEWNFLFDDENIGGENKYYFNFPRDKVINVPFTYETLLSGIGDESVHNTVWYNRQINIAKSDLENSKILLHLEGSDYKTNIWINGNYVGENIGGYFRFSYAIEKYLNIGKNDITIKVSDSLSQSQPRGKQRYKPESWACWYIQTTGIWKTIWLERVSQNYLEHVKTTPCYDDKTLELLFSSNITESEFKNNHYEIVVQISFADEITNEHRFTFTENNQKINVPISMQNDVKKWSPEEPNLYQIEYELYKDDELIDSVSSYFGVRKISIEGNKIFLNEKELYQRLILDQGYWRESHLTPPSEDTLISDIKSVLKFGYNGVRKHQKIEDERFLYWCDKLGLLVWSEMANFYEFTEDSIEEFIKEWVKVVKQNYNHPSIITWVPINESWGVPDIKINKNEQAFANTLYYLTKSLDNTRPVITNDGWEHTLSDIITIHDYKQESDELKNLYIDNESDVLKNNEPYNGFHSLMASSYKYQNQPIIMSEYGGIALISEEGWGYGKQVKNNLEFIERFEDLTNTLREIPYICGYCYTQLTDVQQEINGLLTYDHSEKFSDEINVKIRDINTK